MCLRAPEKDLWGLEQEKGDVQGAFGQNYLSTRSEKQGAPPRRLWKATSVKELNGANRENRANLRNVWKHSVVAADAGGKMG